MIFKTPFLEASPRWRWRAVFTAGLLVACTLALPSTADGGCVSSGPKREPGLPPVGDEMQRMAADREDLLVTVYWSDELLHPDATLVLSTPAGADLASWKVARLPGKETEERLPGALVPVATSGFQFVLRLEGPKGPLDESAFEVAVDCPAGGLCSYQLLPGLTGGPITVSEALWNALDEARGAGSPDLLATVRKQHPELAGEIPGFAWQMEVSEPKAGDDCHCRWLTVVSLTPATGIGPPRGGAPLHRFGTNDDGVAFRAGLQGVQGGGEVTRSETTGRSLLGIHLLCTRSAGGSPVRYPTKWPSRPVLEVRERQLNVCPPPCVPTIRHRTELGGCAQGIAAGRYGLRATAYAEVDASVTVGAQSVSAGGAAVDLFASDGETFRDTELFSADASATLTATGATAVAESGALLRVGAGRQSNDEYSYAFAAAGITYTMRLWTEDVCEGIPEHSSLLKLLRQSSQEGGVTMVRWEDP